jgi:hypothetical protein
MGLEEEGKKKKNLMQFPEQIRHVYQIWLQTYITSEDKAISLYEGQLKSNLYSVRIIYT